MSDRAAVRPNRLTAAALSLLPGLGQVYAGQRRRGITLMLAVQGLMALKYTLDFLVGRPWPYLATIAFFGVTLAIVLVGIWDASEGARRSQAPVARAPHLLAAAIVNLLLLVFAAPAIWGGIYGHLNRAFPNQTRVVRQITTGLLTPDLVVRRSVEEVATGKILVPGPGAPESLRPLRRKRGPQIVLSPSRALPGARISVSGSGFSPDLAGVLTVLGANEGAVGEFRTDSQGRFRASFANPRRIPGDYFVQARVTAPVGGWAVSETLSEGGRRMVETIYLALIGTVLSLILALPLSFFAARNLMSGAPGLRLIYGLTRALFTLLRSVEVLILAVIAVAVFGIGPTAGVIALAIHGIGALGKLYSEAIESIEHEPVEAIRATGANELQVVVYGVIPQVVPQFIAFTLYRWDINVRMATVIGLVGGGGIGYQLIQYMNLLQWREAATCIWLIAAVVMLMDYASAVIREKVV